MKKQMRVEELFFRPPMAIARLGGSSTPLASFAWVEDPSLHGAGQTVIAPDVSLEVLADGSVRPFRPNVIKFRDGGDLRPVAPFLELWVRTPGGDQPLTQTFLADNGTSASDVQYTVTAANLKAARRANDPQCGFSASIRVPGDDHERHALLASSEGAVPLVFPSAPIPLGTFQVMRPVSGKAMGADLDVLRVRFTPAAGQVYGPPRLARAAETDEGVPAREHEVVPASNRILNPLSTWLQYSSDDAQFDSPQPSDTYDGADTPEQGRRHRQNQSFGVVDDTCDVLITATLQLDGNAFEATARIFVAPPDFAPDRRPFASLAEELVDRDGPVQNGSETVPQAMHRLSDLFQRIYETSSLANVNMMRSAMMLDRSGGEPNFEDLPVITAGESMTKRDQPYFDPDKDIGSQSSDEEELPLSSVAQQVHGSLATVDDLELFLRLQPEHVKRLVRPAFARFKKLAEQVRERQHPDPTQRDPRIERDTLHDMRMPPYMRDSDATPLSLNRTQYELLMTMVERLSSKSAGRDGPVTSARAHVSRVVARRSGADSASGRSKRSRNESPTGD